MDNDSSSNNDQQNDPEKKARLATYIREGIIKDFADKQFERLRAVYPKTYEIGHTMHEFTDEDYAEIEAIFHRIFKHCVSAESLERLANKVILDMDGPFMAEVELIEEPEESKEPNEHDKYKEYKNKIYKLFAKKTNPLVMSDTSDYSRMYVRAMLCRIDILSAYNGEYYDNNDKEDSKEQLMKASLLKHFCTDALIMDEKTFSQLVNEGKNAQEIADHELKTRNEKSSKSVVEIVELSMKIKRSEVPNPEDERRVEMLMNYVNKITSEEIAQKKRLDDFADHIADRQLKELLAKIKSSVSSK